MFAKYAVAAAVLMLPVAGAAHAQQAPKQANSAAENSAPKDRMICKRVKRTGSRLASDRVCKPQSVWEGERAENRRDVDRSQIQRPRQGG